MKELQDALLKEWAGVPIVLWLAGMLLLSMIILGVRRTRIHYKGRERDFILETDSTDKTEPKNEPR